MALRNANPVLASTFPEQPTAASSAPVGDVMTLMGTVEKTILLLAVAVAASIPGWFVLGDLPVVTLILAVAAMALVWFGLRRSPSPAVCITYAVLEGLVLGAFSSWYADADLVRGGSPWLPVMAAVLTGGILLSLSMLYLSGRIQPSENFKAGVMAATGGVVIFYLVSIVAGLFGAEFGILRDSSGLSIGFSVAVVLLASANLVLDFDFIERGVGMGAPKSQEWVGAVGILVTVVWLYLEILRLLAKLNSRD